MGALWAGTARAATSADTRKIDFSIPDIPAFTALGVSPSQVSRPGTLRELAASLASGLSPTGGVQSGLALEVDPLLLAGREVPVLKNFRLSAATNAVAQSEGTTTQVAGALRWSYSSGDGPDDDLNDCLALANPKAPPPPPPAAPPPRGAPTIDERVAALEKTVGALQSSISAGARGVPAAGGEVNPADIVRCRAAFQAAHLATRSFELAASAVGSSLDDARLTALKTSSVSAWMAISFAYNSISEPLRRAGKRIARDASGKLQPDDTWNKTHLQPLLEASHYGIEPLLFARVDVRKRASGLEGPKDLTLSARLPVYWLAYTAYIEAGLKLEDFTNTDGNTRVKAPLGIGGNVKISDGTWLSVFFGGDTAGSRAEFFALTNLSWSLGQSRPQL